MLSSSSWQLVCALIGSFLLSSSDAVDSDKTLENVSSRLQFHVPHTLFKDGGYEHREALFGIPPYGGSIAQNVYYADSELCDLSDTNRGYPTRERDPETNLLKPWQPPYVLMVDRGTCSFVQKVRNAQRSGASGVLIADNVCLCTDEECKRSQDKAADCEVAEPIMADDGSGGDVSIPSFLMFKADADRIKEQLKMNQVVQVEMQWSLPTPDDRVEYELWTTPTDEVSREFLKNFRDVAVALGDRAYFTPNMFIHDGKKNKCVGSGGNLCNNLCSNGGRYCATDPDYDINHGVSGFDVVKESLRRICIWNKYGANNGIGKEWWDYVSEFHNRCDSADYFSNPACINDAYQHSRIDGEVIEGCIANSGNVANDGPNSYLDLALKAQERRGIVVLPSAFVNTAALRGVLGVETVFRAICAGFKEGTQPDICVSCALCPDTVGCVKSGGSKCPAWSGARKGDTTAVMPSFTPQPKKRGGISPGTFVFTLLLICGAFGGFAYYHWQRTRDDMREQVRGILADYMPLEEGADGRIGSPMEFAQRASSTQLIT